MRSNANHRFLAADLTNVILFHANSHLDWIHNLLLIFPINSVSLSFLPLLVRRFTSIYPYTYAYISSERERERWGGRATAAADAPFVLSLSAT